MRLAGTCKQYSKNAIAQLTRIAIQSAVSRCRRWPSHATVMKMLEASKSRMVRMELLRLLPYHAIGFALEAFMRSSVALRLTYGFVLALALLGCGDDSGGDDMTSGDGDGDGEGGASG